MTQESYNNYINILRVRLSALGSLFVDKIKEGNFPAYRKHSTDLILAEAILEIMEEYQLPIEALVDIEGYVSPNFLSVEEMQQMDSIIQRILNTNYQIDFVLDTPDGFIVDDNLNPIITVDGSLLISAGGETGFVYLKDALKNPVNVDYIYATTGYKLTGGDTDEVLTSDSEGMGTWQESQGGSAELESDITPTITVGGIDAGETLVTGENLTEVMRKLLVESTLSGLSYTGYSSNLRVGQAIAPAEFFWTVEGSFSSLVFSDSAGLHPSRNVTGLTSFSNTNTYVLNTNGQITFRVQSNTGESTTATTNWVYPSYCGVSATDALPSSSDVDAFSTVLEPSADGVTFPLRTAINEYGWFLVDQLQTGHDYTTWYIDGMNTDAISTSSLVKKHQDTITYNGRTYDVYVFNYPTQLSKNIKLS